MIKKIPHNFIPANHSSFINFFFNLYVKVSLHLNFYQIRFIPLMEEDSWENLAPNHAKSSVLILSNHFAWWDSLMIYRWNKEHIKKKFYCMVLKETLLKNPSLNQVGGYSIDPHHRSLIKSIDYTVELLKNTKNLVLLFPQGILESNHVNRIRFKKGIDRIADKLKNYHSSHIANNQRVIPNQIPLNITTLFIAGFIDFYSNKKPSINIYVSNYDFLNQAEDIENDYNLFYAKARKLQGIRLS